MKKSLPALPKWLRLPDQVGRVDHVLGLLMAFAYVAWLVATTRSVGFPRDEGFYFRAGQDYARWFQLLFEKPGVAVQRSTVDAMWDYNHEHPSLMKSLFGLSYAYLHVKYKVFADASTAFRFPAFCMAGIGVWTTYLFGARAYSRRAGAIAAALFALMPRVFLNAHFACFDVPIAAMWVLCIYVYWRSTKDRTLGWAIAAGIVFGLTLETKHNAWILPAVFVPHALFVARNAIMRTGRAPLPLSLLAMAVIGPLVFYALWPWMWNDTQIRVTGYVNFHMNHEYYNMEFFGRNYFSAPSPRGYMPMMILGTVPGITLLLFVVGGLERIWIAVPSFRAWLRRTAVELQNVLRKAPVPIPRGGPRYTNETDVLLALAFFAAIGPWFLPKTPIFGETKHWLGAYPFLAIFAGRGFELVSKRIEALVAQRGDAWRLAAIVGTGACVVAAPLAITVHSHPLAHAAYTPIIGGAQGAATIGLNRQFWGYTTQQGQPLFAQYPNATIYIHDTAGDAWGRLIAEKRIEPTLRAVGSPAEADLALYHHELHMAGVEYNIWVSFDTRSPAFIADQDGVPALVVYARNRTLVRQACRRAVADPASADGGRAPCSGGAASPGGGSASF